ncbi:MAG: nucleoside-diphosphate kinase [Candidatus Competibacteraceae bacterium]|nr:nucleoside-diphosphate kinase [Candidatus Competibacteraceae bacterium]
MRNLILLKPDAFQRKLVGTLLNEIELRCDLVEMKWFQEVSYDMLKRHYADHVGKDFFPRLVRHMQSGPVLAVSVNMRDSVYRESPDHLWFREQVATWRENYHCTNPANLIHASDSLDDALREERVWFPSCMSSL